METAIKMPFLLTEEEIQKASDELYQKLVVEVEGDRSKYRPAEEVFAEVREKYAKF